MINTSKTVKHTQLYRDKNKRICDLYQQGNTAQKVGEIVGISEGRVYDIVREYGIKKRNKKVL